MTKASKPVIIPPHIAHGPFFMVMFITKISPNINYQGLTWISANKNTPLWKKTSGISENSPEDSSKRTPSSLPSQPVSTQKIKTSLSKSSEKTNKASSESETAKEKWSSKTAPVSLRKRKSENSEASLKSEATKMVKTKLSTTILPPWLDFQNGLLMLKLSFNKKLPWTSKKRPKCTPTWATLTLLLWVFFVFNRRQNIGKEVLHQMWGFQHVSPNIQGGCQVLWWQEELSFWEPRWRFDSSLQSPS